MNVTTIPPNMIGTWELIDWIVIKDGKFHSYPMGEDVQGQLIYTVEGRMSGFLMRADFKDEEPRTPATASICISYAGTFHLEGNQIVHNVLLSTVPEWIGGPLLRTMVWQDGGLLLKTTPSIASDGHAYTNELLWKRLT
ncbi:MAG: lipocalin-like domain-containing protein [Sneathiella sp.]|nr:lipocalin-like domain-containing protein [Sneathiella sp.]